MDLDGTLCNVTGVLHLGHNAFHVAATTVCPPNPDMVQVCRDALTGGVAVLIVTGRSDRWRLDTHDWLVAHRIPYTASYFRKSGDYRGNAVTKRYLAEDIRADGYRPFIAYDDQPDVCQMWRGEGLDVVQVPGWDVRLA